MIITTAGRATSELIAKAKKLSETYGFPYKERNGVSVETFKRQHQDDVVIVGKNDLAISPLKDESTLKFHPNLAMIRAKRIFRGEEEPFITTAKLKEGMSLLDCTLGLASDSIMASIAVGKTGKVIGVEGNPLLFVLVKEGLHSFTSSNKQLEQAMRRIEVIHEEHYSFLLRAESNSVDVVYFDPMFQSAIDTSHGINSIRRQAITSTISPDVIKEAKRVARDRVVLKDHWQSDRFTQLGFTQYKRKTSLFHYGTIELS